MPDLGLKEYDLSIKFDEKNGVFTYSLKLLFRGSKFPYGAAGEQPTPEQCTEAAQAYLARVIADAVMG